MVKGGRLTESPVEKPPKLLARPPGSLERIYIVMMHEKGISMAKGMNKGGGRTVAENSYKTDVGGSNEKWSAVDWGGGGVKIFWLLWWRAPPPLPSPCIHFVTIVYRDAHKMYNWSLWGAKYRVELRRRLLMCHVYMWCRLLCSSGTIHHSTAIDMCHTVR